MKRITLLVLLTIAMNVMAQSVSSIQAEQRAMSFLNGKGSKAKKAQAKLQRVGWVGARDGDAPIYAYNVGTDAGFVIVSGDERTPAILGYSDKGRITDDMPDNMRA